MGIIHRDPSEIDDDPSGRINMPLFGWIKTHVFSMEDPVETLTKQRSTNKYSLSTKLKNGGLFSTNFNKKKPYFIGHLSKLKTMRATPFFNTSTTVYHAITQLSNSNNLLVFE